MIIGLLDKLRVELTADLREAKSLAATKRLYSPREWFNEAVEMLDIVKVLRVQIQDRRGLLRRIENQVRQESLERQNEHRFIAAAKRLLTNEQYLAIWREANQGLESGEEAA